MHEPPSRRVIRYVVFAGACALQLIFTAVFVAGWRVRSPAPSAAVAMTQILLRPAPSKSAPVSTMALEATAPLSPVAVTPATPLLLVPIPSLASSPARPLASPDWERAARLAAAGVAQAEELAQRRRNASGERTAAVPDSSGSLDQQPAFPWSRQPLTHWFDFDPTTLTTSVRLGRHCGFFLVLILPGFGCALGHIDPDPGRGDLFDPKFRPAPLRLPAPALPMPAAP